MAKAGDRDATDWRGVHAALARAIRAGDPPAGAEMPSQQALMARFGVSRHMVRRALALLRQEGLIDGGQGVAPRVSGDRVTLSVTSRTRFSASVSRLGLTGQAELLTQRRRVPPQRIATLLRLARLEPVQVVEILRRVEGRPASLTLHYFAPGPVPRLPPLPVATAGVTAALKAIGIDDYLRQETLVSARMPTPHEAFCLEMPRRLPVLSVFGQNTLPDGAPLEVSESVFRSDTVALAFRFPP